MEYRVGVRVRLLLRVVCVVVISAVHQIFLIPFMPMLEFYIPTLFVWLWPQ